ncbi:MAG: Na/Pi symporter [Thalassobaculum sp.]|uniref:Na/Pi cotransporter family protein n=1 Tax=Thalassobaculum sp. TaxID=2022740 RepID=UPI0032EB680A
MTAGIVFEAVGGLALFLLAMAMMTDGLRLFGGAGLKTLLERSTATRLRGAAVGALVTALVQSSSAVTVATIGFVNAGVLGLPHAIGVVFGANLGTTMTGWLVSLTGFGFAIDTLALPILAVGVALKLTAPGRRAQGLGEALAGFGLFFLGLAFLQGAFAGLSQELAVRLPVAQGVAGVLAYLGIGMAATLLTQSSSAAIALILTAAGQQIVGMDAAAAAIIGANVGTTSTAAFAVIKATPNARRVAAAHILFNLATGLVALALLPVLLWTLGVAGGWLGVAGRPEPVLALFHTLFNLLGVVLMLPLADRISGGLARLFRTAEEDLGRPRHLDRTVAATPALAVAALRAELSRMRRLVLTNVAEALAPTEARAARVERRAQAVAGLGAAITEFATTARMSALPRADAESLPVLIRVARYLGEASRLTPEAKALRDALGEPQNAAASAVLGAFLGGLRHTFAALSETETDPEAGGRALRALEAEYQSAKAALLRLGADRRLSVDRLDRLLDRLSGCHRLIDQFAKAERRLRLPPADDPAAPDGDPAGVPSPDGGAGAEATAREPVSRA